MHVFYGALLFFLMKFAFNLLLFLIFWKSDLPAQSYKTRNLSLQQGLPEYYVSGLIQDKAGFVWVATRDGLARYDGRQFKVFRHRHTSQPSLANNVILSIKPVSDSTILIQLENKNLQLFNTTTEQFQDLITGKELDRNHVKLFNASISSDEKILWGRYNTQLIQFDRQTKKFKTFPFPPFPDVNQFVGNSFLFSEQRLYATLPGQLLEFNPYQGTYQTWKHPLVGRPGKTETYYGTTILQRTNGTILIGAARQLIVFNPQTSRFQQIPIPSTVDTQVGLIYEAADGQIYFTYGMTVYRLSPDDELTLIWTATRNDYQNYFHALLVDHSGVLWIGTNGDGIQQIDLQALPIKTYPYRVNFIHDVLSEELKLTVPAWAKTDRHIYQIGLDGSGPYLSVAIGTWFELLKGEQKDGVFQSIIKRKQNLAKNGISGGNALRMQSDGTIWIFEPHQGILKVDAKGKLLAKYNCPIFIDWVTSIQPIGQTIWLGSEESGLYAYDLPSQRIVRHLRYQPFPASALLSDHVQCLAADPTNPTMLWVGTQEGLSQLDTRTMRCQNWSEEQGLPSGTINSLLTDRHENLWFSTGKGISRMELRTKKMRHFTTSDGLLDIEYRPNHALHLPDGRMAFGGATGTTVFDPLKLNDSDEPIPIVLTELRLANVTVEPGEKDSPLDIPVNAAENIRLRYDQNFFSIEYAGLRYNKPSTLRYRYQLEGVDLHWVDAGNRTLANYTQVKPGDYVFRVNTANAAGRWSPLVKTLRIKIDPPWWGTWWFYLLAMIAFVSVIYGIYRYRLAQVLKLHNLRNAIARDLHDDVGSSISSIAIYSNIMLGRAGDAAFKTEPLLMKIDEQANEIMGSMDDIVWSINTKNDDFDKVFLRMQAHAAKLLEAKGYTLHFDFDEKLQQTKLEMEKRRDFYLIYKEALNNIAKYANGKNVWISAHQCSAGIELQIKDDGMGFEIDRVRSNGNGLSNMSFRAGSLKGTLRIVSETGMGTMVRLIF